MDKYKWAYVAYISMWIATGLAVSTAIIVTRSAQPLWAFILPSLIEFNVGSDKE